ncbi:hypothetical protein [Veillonella intestinalis]|uniref:hypothetical protein n=1 Tax=Veillonella intestinalis TaxID=2941341 RepID=UPI0020416682|nr:hypothetical protein [Veillonella intestinalis]
MSESIIETANDRTRFIDGGKDFIIPQYIHFFLLMLEDLLEESLQDKAIIPQLMAPFNKGYLEVVAYLKENSYSRRHVDEVVEIFNQGYFLVLERPHRLTAKGKVKFELYGHIIISKLCHLVRYEQRYLFHHTSATTMLAVYSWQDLFKVTNLKMDDCTCKSKENPEFSCGDMYVNGCQYSVKLIHTILVSLYCESSFNSHNNIKHLIYRVLQLHEGIYRLDNLAVFISKKVKIQRAHIRRELMYVQYQYKMFEKSLAKILTRSIISTQYTQVAQQLKSLAINTIALQWGLYFLTLLYGSAYIDQRGNIKIHRSSETKGHLVSPLAESYK